MHSCPPARLVPAIIALILITNSNRLSLANPPGIPPARPAPLTPSLLNPPPPLRLRPPPAAASQVEDELYAATKDNIVRRKEQALAAAQVFAKPKKFKR